MHALRDALRSLPDPVYADLLESESAYRLIFDVPGVTAAGLTVEATERTLSIEGVRERPVPEGFEYDTDARSSVLEATIPMPPDTDPTAASASLENGVLSIDVPRSESEGHAIPIEG